MRGSPTRRCPCPMVPGAAAAAESPGGAGREREAELEGGGGPGVLAGHEHATVEVGQGLADRRLEGPAAPLELPNEHGALHRGDAEIREPRRACAGIEAALR